MLIVATLTVSPEFNEIKPTALTLKLAPETVQLTECQSKIGQILTELTKSPTELK